MTAVNDVSFAIRRGEFVGLVGPSGSGKTSMLAMLAGLLRPTHGQIIIANQDVSSMKREQTHALPRPLYRLLVSKPTTWCPI